MPTTIPPVELGDEMQAVIYKRYMEARAAGLTMVEARLFAEADTDVGQLRSLVAAGCPATLIAKIVI